MRIIKSLLIGSLFVAAHCLAVPVTDQIYLYYSGTVVMPPCTISAPAVAVDFGTIPAADLATSDSATDWKEATVKLTNCTNISEIDIAINATPSSANNLYIANGGTAEHVAVQAKMEVPTVMPVYDGITIPVHMVQGQTVVMTAFDFRIRNDGSGAATTGSVKSVVTLAFTFK